MPSSSGERSVPAGEGPRPSVSRSALRHLRRVIVAVIGLTVLAIGVAMIVLPGPATVVIPLGLGILAVEFAWAERMLKRLKDGGNRVLGRGRLQ
jgi:tellurite resistance protein TerC